MKVQKKRRRKKRERKKRERENAQNWAILLSTMTSSPGLKAGKPM
jgi:hypothetical protein